VISTRTAAELIEVLRDVIAQGRLARHLVDADAARADLPFALHTGQAVLLRLLADGGEQRLGVLACALELDASVVSRRVTVLEEAGLLVRRADPEDRRAQLVVLTDAGAEALRRHQEARAEWMAEALSHRSDDEVARIVGDLRGLLTDLHRIPVPGRQRAPAG
jgi:DNA-binding MarR family transcriptional regulator